jgi:UDP-hydrolysing UDP-N-acetyl-D-glucosamine 2-epimerase
LAVSKGIAGIARVLDRLSCDGVIVLGDRIEAFAGACAASLSRRLVVHIHGGDGATGDVDDALRNAISRLAHIHFAASSDAVRRLERMGEQRWRIHRVGAPGLDNIRRFRQVKSPLIQHQPYAVVVQHPCGRSAKQEFAVMNHILSAVRACGLEGVVIYPNSDPGHEGILQAIAKIQKQSCWHIFRSLDSDDYLRVLSQAAVLVGNSSSGIIESASMGIRAVNVGERQAGRLRCGPNVIDVSESGTAIVRAIRRALRAGPYTSKKSVYGDGRAGERMARILEQTRILLPLLQKSLAF